MTLTRTRANANANAASAAAPRHQHRPAGRPRPSVSIMLAQTPHRVPDSFPAAPYALVPMLSRPREQRGEPRAPMAMNPAIPSARQWRSEACRVHGKVKGMRGARVRSVSSTALAEKLRRARRWRARRG